MLSYSQKLMLGNIINVSCQRWYQFKFFVKDWFVNIKFAKDSQILHFDESNEKFSPAVRRYYFLRKIIKHFDPEFLNYKW